MILDQRIFKMLSNKLIAAIYRTPCFTSPHSSEENSSLKITGILTI